VGVHGPGNAGVADFAKLIDEQCKCLVIAEVFPDQASCIEALSTPPDLAVCPWDCPEFTCKDGTTIPESFKCDGEADRVMGEDEAMCP